MREVATATVPVNDAAELIVCPLYVPAVTFPAAKVPLVVMFPLPRVRAPFWVEIDPPFVTTFPVASIDHTPFVSVSADPI